MIRSHVLICGGTGCTSSKSVKVKDAMEAAIAANGLAEEVKVVMTGCFGLCALGPIMIIYPEGTFYSCVTPEDADEIVTEHLLKGRPVERLVYHEAKSEDVHHATSLSETAFYKKQKRVALRNCGVINPEEIDEYIAMDGYRALGKVLTEMTPDDVIQTILDSGLRGRGGGGFPTGVKWDFAAQQQVKTCNSARKNNGYRTFGQCAQTHHQDGKPGYRSAVFVLGPSGKGIYGAYNAERQYHIHSAGVCRTENLKTAQTDEACRKGRAGIPSFGIVDIHPCQHQYAGQRTRKTCRPLAHAAQYGGGGGNAPMEEWRLVSHLASVVVGQYPVVLLKHGQRHDGFAWFSFSVKVGKPQPGKGG